VVLAMGELRVGGRVGNGRVRLTDRVI
jgi:hypothetical protein